MPAQHPSHVRKRYEVSSRLLQLAMLQDHVITREQALAHGLSRHSVDRLVVSGALAAARQRNFLDGSAGAVVEFTGMGRRPPGR